MRTTATLFCACFLVMHCGGCSAVQPAASDLAPPSPRLMKPPEPLPEVKAGDEIYRDDAQCSASHARLRQQIGGLQGWARTVLKKD